MSTKPRLSDSPTGIQRWFLRAPITLYHWRLGWMMGGRFMLVNHIGRKSGKVRQVVIEVIKHDKSEDIYYAASGWGYKSQWYQNIQKTPDISIQVGNRKLDVMAETLPPQNGAEVLIEYRQKHPFAAKELGKVMDLEIDTAPENELVEIVSESLPIVAFRKQT